MVFSPSSIHRALTMALAGAHGKTADAMNATLHGFDGIHDEANALDLSLAEIPKTVLPAGTDGSAPELDVADSVWGQSGLTIQPAYLDVLARHYGAGLQTVDYRKDPEGARKAINVWVADHTAQLIKDLVPQGAIHPLTRLVLADAVRMKAEWAATFTKEATAPLPFHRLDGTTVDVPTMRNGGAFVGYAKGDGWQAADLPYVGGRLSFLVVLPDAGRFAAVENGLDGPGLQRIAAALEPTGHVDLSLPKLSLTSSLGLKDALTSLGMGIAFTDGADFSGITTDEGIVVDDVVHQAVVKVDEYGTEAAAATAVVMAATSAPLDPVTFTVDRPYLFAIRDRQTGLVLFLGRVVDPSR